MSEPLINPKALEAFRDLQTADDPYFVREFLNAVLAAIPPKLDGIQRAIEQADYRMLESEAHALKSSCANTEIASMTALCLELEKQGKAMSAVGAPQLLERLRGLYEKLRLEIFALPEFNEKS